MILNIKLLSILLISLFFFDFNAINCARGGGRGGGGGRVGGGSRFGGGVRAGSNSGGSFGSSRTSFGGVGGSRFSSGTRTWTQVAAGLFAYNIMSRMAHGRHYYGGGSYYYPNRKPTGYFCRNVESFNGTVYDKFQCPLGDFPSDYKYCCGPTNYQYCCKFFDDTGRTVGIVFAVLAFIGVIFCTVFCIVKLKRSSQNGFFKGRSNGNNTPTFQGRPPQPPQQQFRPPPQGPFYGGPRPGYNSVPPPPSNIHHQNVPMPYPTAQAMPSYPPNLNQMPLSEINRSQLPYPTEQPPSMPAPAFNNADNTDYPPPPGYSEIVKNKQNEHEVQPLMPRINA